MVLGDIAQCVCCFVGSPQQSTMREKQSLAIYYGLLSDFNSVYVDNTSSNEAIIDPQWVKHTKKEIEDFKKLR